MGEIWRGRRRSWQPLVQASCFYFGFAFVVWTSQLPSARRSPAEHECPNSWRHFWYGPCKLYNFHVLASCYDVIGCIYGLIPLITDIVLDILKEKNILSEPMKSGLRDILLKKHRHQHEKSQKLADANSKISVVRTLASIADLGRTASKSLINSEWFLQSWSILYLKRFYANMIFLHCRVTFLVIMLAMQSKNQFCFHALVIQMNVQVRLFIFE